MCKKEKKQVVHISQMLHKREPLQHRGRVA